MSYVNVILGSIVLGIGIIMFRKLHSPIRKKIKELEQEKDIREWFYKKEGNDVIGYVLTLLQWQT